LTDKLTDISPQLLRQIAEGDELAFKRLFDCYRIRFFRFALEITKSATDAEDIVQDIFIKIWTNRQHLGTIDEPRPYLYAITRNYVFDYLQKIARNEKMVKQLWAKMQTSTNEPEMLLLSKEFSGIITEAVDKLTPAKRKVFQMSREEGLTHRQIAEKIGLSASRVKNIMVECLKFIRQYLRDHASPLPLYLIYIFSEYINLEIF